jgi:hypothetical protein
MSETNIQAQNVLVGAGELFWAPHVPDEEQPLPDFTNPPPNAIRLEDYFFADQRWQYLGATQEGVELNYSPDYGEVEVDQVKGAIILFNQALEVTMSTQLAETTLENLLFAWGVADDYLKTTQDGSIKSFSIGVPGDDPVERSLVVISKGTPYDENESGSGAPVWVPRQRLYFARRIISFEGSSLAMRRTENTAFPIEFRLMPDTNFRDAEYGMVIERAGDDTTANPNPVDVFRTGPDGELESE